MPRLRVLLAVLGLLPLAGGAGPGSEEGPAPPETFRADGLDHWAFQVPRRPDPPEVRETSWIRNPIDQFLLAALEEMGFVHAPEADRIALIRRVTFDLTGLPPSPAEVEAFARDRRPDAYERLVDRLLASPHYGERWAQHWLDLAHYADTNGFELDAERPDAWRYRDWVVAALNADLPYDQFVGLQLAGDELRPGDPSALIATGFGRCGPREVVGGNVDPVVRRQSELAEVTGTVGSALLGLTIGCARCHDHKFDPLPTTDYYRLQAVFAAAEPVERPIAAPADEAAYATARKAADEEAAPLRLRQAELEEPYRRDLLERKRAMLTAAERAVLAVPEDRRTPAQKTLAEGVATALKVSWEEVAAAVAAHPEDHAERERLKRAIHAIEARLPRPPARAMALVDVGTAAPETFVALRGDPHHPGPKVTPRPPGILLAAQSADAFPEPIAATAATTGRRLALARWLTRPDHPMTARVIVNRLWQHHFGRGIVATPSDFGTRGEEPSHPELLDWLATELVRRGWHLKPIHRLLVTSAAYRQASAPDPRAPDFEHWSAVFRRQAGDDPENTLLWRMNRRRLEAEGLRDALLAVAGELNPKAGGPGVLVPIEGEIEALIFTEAEVVDLWPETPDPREHLRRALYLYRKRNVRYPMFDAFDAPDTQTACPVRGVSTHALQALVLLNSEFALARAKGLAGRLYREAGGRTEARIVHAYRDVLARDPRPDEVGQVIAFLDGQAKRLRARANAGLPLARPGFVPEGTDPAEAAAWVDFARAMLNRNEFVYVP
ncbi:MAG TPA: DUF1549 and DUF1553 domain-containing protein [Isosphaeraceae bacterium]|jgi:hypothetical protein